MALLQRRSFPHARSNVMMLGLLAAALLFIALISLSFGTLPSSFGQVVRSLLQTGSDPLLSQTILQLRLPRVLLGLLVGAALGISGATMQGLFRNPLAEPGLIGMSSGAAVAAIFVIVLGRHIGLFEWIPQSVALPIATFIGASVAATVVVRLARTDGITHSATLLLAGLAINAIAGGAIGLLSYLASDDALRASTYWLFGSLARAGWPEIACASPLLLVAIVLLPRFARELDALQLGEIEAGYLGIDVERLKRKLLLLVLLAVGGSVALTGAIGFIGLIAPHLIRLIAGSDHRRLMPASALLGAGLLTLADLFARTVAMPADLPIGILTSLIGGPFFIFLLLRIRRNGTLA